MKILMVCLGNICRSVLAEGVMRSKLPEEGYEVNSAGTANYHVGERPDARSIETGRRHGVDISGHRGRQFVIEDFDKYDYIFVMDKSNYRNVVSMCRGEDDVKKVSYLMDELGEMKGVELSDPYYRDMSDFEDIFVKINKSAEVIAHKIIKSNIKR